MVSFTGDKELLYKANFHCRTALRILKPIYHFKAKDADTVYKEVKKVEWEKYLSLDKTFAIDSVAPIPPGSRKDHRPPRPAAQADRQIHGREDPAHGALLVVQRPLPHHLLRAIGTAQIALLLPLCPDIGHNGLYPAGVHRIPVFETRRAEPGVDRAGEGDGTPTGHPSIQKSSSRRGT